MMPDGTLVHKPLTKDRKCPCEVDTGVTIDMTNLKAALKNTTGKLTWFAAIRRSINLFKREFTGKGCVPCPDMDALNQVQWRASTGVGCVGGMGSAAIRASGVIAERHGAGGKRGRTAAQAHQISGILSRRARGRGS